MRLPSLGEAIGMLGDLIQGRTTEAGNPMKLTRRGYVRIEPDLYHDELPGNSGHEGDTRPWRPRPNTRTLNDW